jgi:hypothetical protein
LIPRARANAAIDVATLSAIQAERLPEIEMLQAGQIRAHGMVLKPLAVLQVAFTMMTLFLPMIDKKAAKAMAGLKAVTPEYPVPLGR